MCSKSRDCPAHLAMECKECPYNKGLCDYPYIGARKVLMSGLSVVSHPQSESER